MKNSIEKFNKRRMSLTLFVGCQKARKTISNITKSTEYVDVLDEQGLFINSTVDTRDSNYTLSSNSSSYRGVSDRFTCLKVTNLSEVYDKVNIDVFPIISIDEIQFFPDLENFVIDLLKRGKHIICSGLDTDWMGKDFGQVKELLKHSTEFRKMSAKCKWCIDDDTTKDLTKISDACRTGKIAGSNEQIECGGDDKYIPLCMKHHHHHLVHLHGLDPYTLQSIRDDTPIKKRKFSEDSTYDTEDYPFTQRSLTSFFDIDNYCGRNVVPSVHHLFDTNVPRDASLPCDEY